jgi:prepilin-type processing-associated H-X9-DG protein
MANYAFADGHVKAYRYINLRSNEIWNNNTTLYGKGVAKDNMDYDCDGVMGNDSANGTAGNYD